MKTNITLCPIQPATTEVERATTLYMNSFPECERRELREWTALLTQSNKSFMVYAIKAQNNFTGFISCWDFDDFIYVEHFAIDPSTRGNGIGGTAIQALAAHYSTQPLVLEVEPPTNDIAIRRIHFYERQGFFISNTPYLQPPYRKGDEWFELKLMCTDIHFLDQNIETIQQIIYKNVYGVK